MSIKARWFKKIDVRGPNDCWPWRGAKLPFGYGVIEDKKAHRLAYTFYNGEIPPKTSVLHTCDNPSCVNPAHLFLGNQKINMRDMVKKGRQKTRSDRPWNRDKYLKVLERHGLTQIEAARLLGVAMRTGQRWAVSGPPFAVALIFRLMEAYGLTVHDLKELGDQLSDEEVK